MLVSGARFAGTQEDAFKCFKFLWEMAGGMRLTPLERFPLGLNRDFQGVRKGGVLAGDSVSGMRFARRIGQFVRRLSTEVAPNSSLMQDILQHDRNPL
jgi:hypothetical protein